jgi:hypothetical protein
MATVIGFATDSGNTACRKTLVGSSYLKLAFFATNFGVQVANKCPFGQA